MLPVREDALSARLIEKAGYPASFMTGYGLAATKGYPDTGLVSYKEVLDIVQGIASVTTIPVIADADTGYGNPMNLKRTVSGFAQAMVGGIMIEDQVFPKRCGHTKGKAIVSREEAFARIRAAVDARKESGIDIFIMARTDARGTDSLDEAIYRCQKFHELGADMTFLEAPRSLEEMERLCKEIPGFKCCNVVEGGLTPVLPTPALAKLGYVVAIHPVTIFSAAIKAMSDMLEAMKDDTAEGIEKTKESILDFKDLSRVVGFDDYYKEEG
ncbi:putative carboxyvinyl-carboxyphosphonate phosphorylmutase [Gonapodya prolifera JEL478]|uniref:Putative carboxyvinyl-carboxyphosphonate phosphorylmutase n=1 Tax=Gonapodya prolifera (strain JEL478) TaxID=1344416 RepID=A0A139AWN4_GONPJ|nr:putative carboxyvinyl-carboxyphosphonate phosphorylmutase [Gonapodya prolifera JEL478]|eukprot:KXS21146.1 putative carboxyvinyl-carboxyphosphonate phosphorylmutase [Gonapodya prolifera JEL478]